MVGQRRHGFAFPVRGGTHVQNTLCPDPLDNPRVTSPITPCAILSTPRPSAPRRWLVAGLSGVACQPEAAARAAIECRTLRRSGVRTSSPASQSRPPRGPRAGRLARERDILFRGPGLAHTMATASAAPPPNRPARQRSPAPRRVLVHVQTRAQRTRVVDVLGGRVHAQLVGRSSRLLGLQHAIASSK